ncbi:spexin prohormone 2-like [Odontesthes bonariensis]|uniref:spexin prohormone 2-like n=1 Tax=Odontesthes bonariensis TaxID=219752 RepID=UPI003F58DA1F
MKTKAAVIWTWSLVLSLFAESCHAQKNVHWGPQSMMYLKGKYGKRFVEDDHSVLRQALQSFYALLRGVQRMQLLGLKKPNNIGSSEKVVVHYLQQR